MLKDDILPALHNLILDLGCNPGKSVTEFDHKRMGSKITNYLHSIDCSLESAPPRHQHQNGLVECNWHSVIQMDRSWINLALLSLSFWYFAVTWAVEVSNYLPITLGGENNEAI